MVGKQSNPFEFGERQPVDPSVTASLHSTEVSLSGVEKLAQGGTPAVPRAKARPWKVWLAALGACGIFGGVGGAAFWWLTTPPPSPDCRQLSPLATDMEQLLCAQQSAKSGDLPKILAGLELLGSWPPEHPLYQEAQRLIAEWSDPVLTAAQERIARSDLQGAIALAQRIPKTSPSYKQAQADMAEWKQDWQKGEAIATQARQAMQAQNWVLANEKIALLKGFTQDHWRFDRVNALSQLLLAEQRGRQILAQARTVSQGAQAPQLGAAIALLSQINPQTYAWVDAQNPLKQWSETLLAQGLQFWQQGQLNAAMERVLPVLKDRNRAQTAQELLWLSRASQHALASSTTLKPTLPQLWNLSAAIATVQLIPAESRYRVEAQKLLQNWQAQFQDLSLLQLAWGIGEIPHPLPKQIALWQTAQVTPDRPRRAQAQTLQSYWQVEIRRLQDLPYLALARQSAAKGTIAALNQAIAQAQLITPNRPSRKEAQTLIASWTQQIQAIADRPILQQAWAFANQGNLQGAIQVASGIAPGRSLYGEAQAAIGDWQASIRAAELARVRQQEAERQRSRVRPDPDLPEPSDKLLPDQPATADTFPPPEAPAPAPSPSNIYPPGTEPPPPQIPGVPPSEPPPPPVQPPPPPYYQPYTPDQ